MNTIPEEYQAIMRKIVSEARQYLSQGKELLGVVFFGITHKSFMCSLMDMSNAQTKEISVAVIRKIAEKEKADFAITINEAWGIDSDKISHEEFEEYLKTHNGISEHPDRMDVVMITLETYTGYWLAQVPIKSLEGKARGFDEVKFSKLERVEGRLANLLPRGTIH